MDNLRLETEKAMFVFAPVNVHACAFHAVGACAHVLLGVCLCACVLCDAIVHVHARTYICILIGLCVHVLRCACLHARLRGTEESAAILKLHGAQVDEFNRRSLH